MSTKYEMVSLPLDPRQQQRLMRGEAVRLKHAEIGAAGNVPVPLTATQMARMAKAQAAGKGVQIKLSQAQLAACVHHGSGIVSDAAARAKEVASDAAGAAKGLAASLLEQFGQQGLDAASNAAGSLTSKLPDYLKPFADVGVKLGSKYATDQLQALLHGLHSTKNGQGLYAPGTGGGLFAPGIKGGALSELTAFELDEFLEIVRKQVHSYVADTMEVNSGVEHALKAFDHDCQKLHDALAKETDEHPAHRA